MDELFWAYFSIFVEMMPYSETVTVSTPVLSIHNSSNWTWDNNPLSGKLLTTPAAKASHLINNHHTLPQVSFSYITQHWKISLSHFKCLKEKQTRLYWSANNSLLVKKKRESKQPKIAVNGGPNMAWALIGLKPASHKTQMFVNWSVHTVSVQSAYPFAD